MGRHLVLDCRFQPVRGKLLSDGSRTEQGQRMGREIFVDLVGVTVSMGTARRQDHRRVVIAVVTCPVVGRRYRCCSANRNLHLRTES